jgi:hypothetical protein
MASVKAHTVTNRKVTKPPSKKLSVAPKAKVRDEPVEGFYGKPPVAIVMHGPSGVGKSSWAAHWPKPIFIIDEQEDGISDLVDFGEAPEPLDVLTVENYNGLLKLTEKFGTKTRGARTLVFDSLTGFEKLLFIHHCEEHFDGDWSKKGFLNYGQGPKNANKIDWPRWFDLLNAARRNGLNIILLAHSQIKQFNNPEGPDYDQYIPYLDKEIWQTVHRWAQAILFYNYYTEVKKEGIKTKADQEDQRNIYTVRTPAFHAKNRMGLEPVIDAGDSGKTAYRAFVAAFKAAANKSKKRDD